jgi:hypothetical protein
MLCLSAHDLVVASRTLQYAEDWRSVAAFGQVGAKLDFHHSDSIFDPHESLIRKPLLDRTMR